MDVYIAAASTELFDVSGYSVKIGNTSKANCKHAGWTVVEASLNGLLAASEIIIRENIIRNCNGFTVVTTNSYLKNLLDPEHECGICALRENGWRNPDGTPIMHLALLKQIAYHHDFYEERGIKWESTNTVDRMGALMFNAVYDDVAKLLGIPLKSFI